MPIQKLPGTAVVANSIPSAAIASTVSFGPKITSVAITDNSYTVLDDTAVSTGGGNIKITGTGFVSGCTVIVGAVAATSVSFVSSTQVNVQVPAQAAGSYIVYLTNPDGGLAIRVNALNYSAMPSWSTTSPLANGINNQAISIQLSASSNSTVTYALQAGSSLPAGLSLSSSGLLSGTVSGLSVETTYNFTVVATDAELQDTPQAFSITISVADQYFRYTTLLLSPSLPTATFVTDASTNNFAITVAGDARPNNFGPYQGNGYYSNYFSGGNNFSIANNTALQLGSSDFTIELWFNTSDTTNNNALISKAVNGYLIGVNGGVVYVWLSSSGSSWDIANGTNLGSIVSGTWNHVAVSRSGSSIRMFLNGVLITTVTSSASIYSDTSVAYVGYWTNFSATFNCTAYISNVRIVKGTAVYTAAFTPPTAPLTAITNTSLLTCQSSRFLDTSTNAFTITLSGSPQISGFIPYLPSTSYSGLGSGYFDGSGDYLTSSSSSALDLSTTDWTIQGWYYPTAYSASNNVLVYIGASGTDKIVIATIGTAGNLYYLLNGSTAISSSTAAPLNAWSFFALVKSSGTTTLYLNGVSLGTTSSVPTSSNKSASIGADAGGATYQGYFSDIRALKGTATTAIPTTPLTAIANTSLLTLQNNQPNNNSMFVDSSTNNFTITRAGNATQGSFTPYAGGYSVYFGTKTDYLSVPATTNLTTFTGDFTFEAWINPTDTSISNSWGIWDSRQSGGTAAAMVFAVAALASPVTGQGRLLYFNGSYNYGTGIVYYNQWNHVAWVRSGSTMTFYVNGVAGGTATISGTQTGSATTNPIYIGSKDNGGSGYGILGYVSNFRIVNGTAVYTGNFTPSTAPLTPIANTVLLTCADNRFRDASGINATVTAGGTPSVQRFNPFAPQTAQVPASYGVLFNGSTDYLAAPNNAAFTFGTGNFTLEFWIYTSNLSSKQDILDKRASATVSGWFVTMNGSPGKIIFYANGPGFPLFTSNTNVSSNTWTHVAIVRNGTSFKMYQNGAEVASATSSASMDDVATTLKIGGGPDNNTWNGYISNLRIVNGTALYTSAFTPPTAPLTAITNTSLLTCQSTTIVDNSANAFAITIAGSPKPGQFNPFGYTNPSSTSYTPATYGGSAYFDGTGDSISIASNSFWNLSGDFTVELWAYITSTANRLLAIPVNGSFAMYLNSSGFPLLDKYAVGAYLTSSKKANFYSWNHICAVRSGSTTTIYVNGESGGSVSDSTNFPAGTLYIGFDGSASYCTGYITDVRWTKGQALYTSNFVPPTTPLTAVKNSTLLLNMTSAAIYDSTMTNNFETVADAKITTVAKKYGSVSMYFDGTGDYVGSSLVQPAGSGDFTIECWAYITGSVSNCGIWQLAATLFPGTTSGLSVAAVSSAWQIYYGGTTASGGTSALNTWYHLAMVRSGTSLKLYVNGTSVISVTDSTNYTGQALSIGGYYTTGYLMTGYISDFRITRGYARYTANFTAPASAVLRQ